MWNLLKLAGYGKSAGKAGRSQQRKSLRNGRSRPRVARRCGFEQLECPALMSALPVLPIIPGSATLGPKPPSIAHPIPLLPIIPGSPTLDPKPPSTAHLIPVRPSIPGSATPAALATAAKATAKTDVIDLGGTYNGLVP